MTNIMHPKGRTHSYETPVPGCLGRVVNLFDLNSRISRNKLLTDKLHFDVSPLSRSRSETSPTNEDQEDRMIDSDMRSSFVKKSERTPVKNVMAQEMSNSLESRHSSPNVVAKLMGLDALPQESYPAEFGHKGRFPKCHSRACYSEIPGGYWKQGHDFDHEELSFKNHHRKEQPSKYKDVYEMWHPSSQASNLRKSVLPQKGRFNDNSNEGKMALVRQKFMDAKRLSTDEKLRQTKEFQDALEVLSSNQDLFLRVLQELDSIRSATFVAQQQMPPSETKRITVLKPSKMVHVTETQFRKSPTMEHTNNAKDIHHYTYSTTVASWKAEECPSQATQIVVLKPSTGRIRDGNALPSSTRPITPRQAEPIEKSGADDRVREEMEVAKEIPETMPDKLTNRRDETLLSSVFSNGYAGNESSFTKSEAEILVDSLSDSEVMYPTSRHSWDCASQYGCPYCCSSSIHLSYSPESSVCQEAKKRLSERCSMVASNETGEKQMYEYRSSITLGEMLALSDVTKPEINEVEVRRKDQESRASTSCLSSNTREGEIESPKSLMRSKSHLVSSTASAQKFTLDQGICKTTGMKETLKQITKSSFRGRLTSLLFSRIMRSSKKKALLSLTHDKVQVDSMETSTSCAPFDHSSKCSVTEEGQSSSRSGRGTPTKGAQSAPIPADAAKFRHNQEQPSRTLLLDLSFEDDGKTITSFTVPNQSGKYLSLGQSNLIDKSPPIGSLPRTLSWDELCTDTKTSKRGAAEEEEEWIFLVRSLVSAASLGNASDLRWHSPQSPFNPLLRDKYANPGMTKPSQNAKWRHLRPIRHLVFDFVNAALVDMAGHMGTVLEDRVWARMKEWLDVGGCEGESMWGLLEEDGGDGCRLAAEKAARKEVMGKGWDDEKRLEVESMVKEMEGKLMEEMVEEVFWW